MIFLTVVSLTVALWYGLAILLRARANQAVSALMFMIWAGSTVAFLYSMGWLNG